MTVFGGVYLAQVAGHALFVTLSLIAVTLACGVAAAVPLARTVRAAMRQAPSRRVVHAGALPSCRGHAGGTIG